MLSTAVTDSPPLAVDAAGIRKGVTLHALRHSFPLVLVHPVAMIPPVFERHPAIIPTIVCEKGRISRRTEELHGRGHIAEPSWQHWR